MELDNVVGRTFVAARGFRDQTVLRSFAIMRTTKSFGGSETKQNQTQRQQPIDDLRKLSNAELLEI